MTGWAEAEPGRRCEQPLLPSLGEARLPLRQAGGAAARFSTTANQQLLSDLESLGFALASTPEAGASNSGPNPDHLRGRTFVLSGTLPSLKKIQLRGSRRRGRQQAQQSQEPAGAGTG